MNRLHRRVLWLATTGVAGLSLALLTGCDLKDQLLAAQQPGVISPADAQGAIAADGLYNGAVGNFKNALTSGTTNQEAIWQFSGLFADEFRTSNTFTQHTDADQRTTQANDVVLGPIYVGLQQSRGFARTALQALAQYSPGSSAKQAEMYFAIAFAEMQLAENFCNGIPLGETVDGIPHYSAPLATKDVFAVALARTDSGLSIVGTARDTASVLVRSALLLTKGRLLVDLGQFPAAATAVATVPLAYQYNALFSQTTSDNGVWLMQAGSKRYSVSDSVDASGIVANALPFVSARDPRVPTTRVGNGFDSVTPYFQAGNWNRDDPMPIVHGLDGQLIQAEAQLNAGDYAGMTVILNALRASPPTQGIFKPAALAALVAPTLKPDAVSLFFREKAFWTFGRGQRLGDLRRLVRQYGRPQNQVYPSGVFFKGGNYGQLTQLPVPDSERSNPLFTGCIDTNP
jgi:hypothetical protein